MTLTGKVAVVTGAGRGIGGNVARALAGHGVRVVVNDIGAAIDGTGTNEQIAGSVVRDINDQGGQAVVHLESIASFAGAESLIDCAMSDFGRLDIVVNCAGNSIMGLPWELTEEAWDSVVGTHLKGHFAVMRAASAPMREQRSGTMITVASRAGLVGVADAAPYCSAKAGITGLTKSFALALSPYGVTVNAISPSASTRMSEPPVDIEALRSRGLRRGIREAEDTTTIESWVAFLATPAAAGITGNIFSVSGPRIGLYGPWDEAAVLDADGRHWSFEDLLAAVPASELGRLAMAGDDLGPPEP